MLAATEWCWLFSQHVHSTTIEQVPLGGSRAILHLVRSLFVPWIGRMMYGLCRYTLGFHTSHFFKKMQNIVKALYQKYYGTLTWAEWAPALLSLSLTCACADTELVPHESQSLRLVRNHFKKYLIPSLNPFLDSCWRLVPILMVKKVFEVQISLLLKKSISKSGCTQWSISSYGVALQTRPSLGFDDHILTWSLSQLKIFSKRSCIRLL